MTAAISIITLVHVNNMNDRIVIFNQHIGKFIKNIFTPLGTKDLTTYLVAEAYDFKTPEKAQEWAEESGFTNLVILKQTT